MMFSWLNLAAEKKDIKSTNYTARLLEVPYPNTEKAVLALVFHYFSDQYIYFKLQ